MRDGETFEGRIVGSDETSVRIEVNGSIRDVEFDGVGKAVVQVEFPKEAG